MEAVNERGRIDTSRSRSWAEVRQGYTSFIDGDVVVAKITPCFENGKGALIRGCVSGVGAGTTEFHVIRPSSRLAAGFLAYVIRSERFRSEGAAWMTGSAGQQRVPEEFVKQHELLDLSLAMQVGVAAHLDQRTDAIDALIEKRERLVERVAERRAAVIHQAVTKGLNERAPLRESGVPWFGRIPTHWDIYPLRRLVREFVDYRGRTPEKTAEGIPLVTAGAVRDGRIDHARAPEWVSRETHLRLLRRGRPAVGDLVFTTEAPLGEVGLVGDTNIALAQRIILFKVNTARVLSEFLRLHFLSKSGRDEICSRGTGSTAEGIRADRLRMSLVPVPPVLEQAAICQHVADAVSTDTQVEAAAQKQIVLLREYRHALITAAVSGQIKVPEEVTA